jgi:hypothetical protein
VNCSRPKPGPSTIWHGPMRPDTIKPNSNFVPGRVESRAELAAQARPYVLFFGSGRHDGPTGP